MTQEIGKGKIASLCQCTPSDNFRALANNDFMEQDKKKSDGRRATGDEERLACSLQRSYSNVSKAAAIPSDGCEAM